MSTTAGISPTDSAVVIRRARRDDSSQVFGLLGQLGTSYPSDREAFDRAFEAAVLESTDHLLYVAALEGRVVGYALTTISRPLYTNGDAAQLQELVVDEPARGLGIGSLLVTTVEGECRRRGIRQLTVASSRGASFYERLDYRSTADFLKKIFSD
jgi:ribosomal protein S18 acetylase RimI-like enzyme